MINLLSEQPWLLVLVFGGFILDWLAIECHWIRFKPITKVIAILLVILWTLNTLDWKVDLFTGMLVTAQFFGLLGDVFLLFSDRWFLWGLTSFFLGHIVYHGINLLFILGQNRFALMERLWWIVLCVIIWLALLIVFYTGFGVEYKKRHANGKLWGAIQIYFWVLSGLVIMTLLNVLVRSLPMRGTIILLLGAGFFLTSDILLAFNRFIQPIERAQLKVRITYHLAQILLAIGFIELYR